MTMLEVNRICFLAGVETALRDICFTNFIDGKPEETSGEQYLLPFDEKEIAQEKAFASAFFDIVAQGGYFSAENRFEDCQEMAWQYVATSFGLDTLDFDPRLVSIVQKNFRSCASVFIDKDIDGKEYIFIE